MSRTATIPTFRAVVAAPPPGTRDVYLDIETPMVNFQRRDWQRTTPLLFACTWDEDAGWRLWHPDSLDLLRAHLADKRVVTWNGDHFDLPVLAANGGYAPQPDPAASLDLMKVIEEWRGCRYKLEEVAGAALGQHKTMAAAEAIQLFRSPNPRDQARAISYCRQDVCLLVELHRWLQDGKALALPPKHARGRFFEQAMFCLRESSASGNAEAHIDALCGQKD